MISIIVLVLHILICLFIFFEMFTGKIKLQKYMLIITVLLPLWGAIIVMVLHFELGFKNSSAIDIASDKMTLESELYRPIVIDEKRSVKTVPIEEALLINSAKEKRAIIMDILNEDPRYYVEFLQTAGNNDDTEVVHYAVTAMVEISKENDYTLQKLEEEYNARPHDFEVLSKYCDFLWSCLSQELMQGQVEAMNRDLFSKLIQEKLKISEELEDYNRFAQNELKRENVEVVKDIIAKIKRKWPHSEEYILLNIHYLALTNNGRAIKKFINKVNNSQIFLSSKTKEVLAFWAD